ncbi:MAG: deoxyhypusine synthase [Candidatus Methanomethyliaceae archaeon]
MNERVLRMDPKQRSMREAMISEKVEDLIINKDDTVSGLMIKLKRMGGFMAPRVAKAAEILKEMFSSGATNFLSFTGNVISTGLRGTLAQLIRRGNFSAIVTTCGALDHDIARSFGARYACGEFDVDDSMLNELEIHRLGNVFIPLEDYGPLIERVMRDHLPQIMKDRSEISPSDLAREFGRRINDDSSILRAAFEKGVPVFVPGIVDGSFGTNLFFYAQTNKLKLDLFKDMNLLLNMVFDSKKTGALIIGGGISKHHVIWWNQFKDGLDYCVYLTTAQEYDGSLSGALPKEAISWGKIKPTAKHVAVIGDVTITLPLIVPALL